ncbi:nuclear transport factor 2 family protein [Rufibacter latericius]|uniref:DUF4440 domain-containing protein n=1 Tax=Rufibacter latericius TaxID=2487040 RepID=A0A3M9ML89_9BACT|nr:nuclear transport factor 2 family protein [Rufibacter latericius]RNI25643.1 DUF4440 domain-containing protein [Rufibacter latericius]
MQKQIFPMAALVVAMFLASFSQTAAQTKKPNFTQTLLPADSLFWVTYNHCDTERMKQFVTDDLEFYHDKGGITLGKTDFISSVQKNLCGNENFRVRREPMRKTIKVYPLHKGDSLYGAIISGDHLFYNQTKGQKEILAGQAKFSNLWLLKDGTWKMARVLSYDHGPVPYRNARKAIQVPSNTLSHFTGEYDGPKAGKLTIKKENNALVLLTKGQKMALLPESSNRFFAQDRDLTFEFIRGKETPKMVVRENGEVVEEAVLLRK